MQGGGLKQLIYYGAEDVRLTGTAFMRIRTQEEESIFQEKRKREAIIQREEDELYELEHEPPTIMVKIGCVVLGIIVIFGLFHGVPPPYFGGQRIPRRKRTEQEISEIILKDSLIIT